MLNGNLIYFKIMIKCYHMLLGVLPFCMLMFHLIKQFITIESPSRSRALIKQRPMNFMVKPVPMDLLCLILALAAFKQFHHNVLDISNSFLTSISFDPNVLILSFHVSTLNCLSTGVPIINHHPSYPNSRSRGGRHCRK